MLPPHLPRQGQRKDMTGQRFGKLVVLEFAGTNKPNGLGHVRWRCRCECGKETIVVGYSLRAGITKSCGCHRAEVSRQRAIKRNTTHGYRNTPEYRCWGSMRNRCMNPNNDNFKDYGARGIAVDSRWNEFPQFFADMGPRPSPRHTIERKDNDGPYSSENCFWLVLEKQALNRRGNRYITAFGLTLCLAEWCRRSGVSRAVALTLLKHKSPEIVFKSIS
jgi:hypothetical protein